MRLEQRSKGSENHRHAGGWLAVVKVRFEKEAKPRIYSTDGTEKQTEYLEVSKSGRLKTKFVFGNTACTGVFVNGRAREREKVTSGN